MAFDPDRNQPRNRRAENILQGNPSPMQWLIGWAHVQADEELGSGLENNDVAELLFQAGLIKHTHKKKSDLSNAYEQLGLLHRDNESPVVRRSTRKLIDFIKLHEERMRVVIGDEAIERAWNAVRARKAGSRLAESAG